MNRYFVLTFILLLSSSAVVCAQPEKQAQPADARDELRYDGKSFSYWEKFLRTELKADKRIEALRAMAAFGARGYPKEAASAIIELLKYYDDDEAAFQFAPSAPEKGTPDQRNIHEALRALDKIGSAAGPLLLAQLDRKAIRRAVDSVCYIPTSNMLGGERRDNPRFAINRSSVPILVRWMKSKDNEIRDCALGILGTAIAAEEYEKKETSLRTIFVQVVTKEKSEKAIVAGLTLTVEDEASPAGASAANLLGALGSRAKSAVPALVRAELRAEWQRAGYAAKDALAEIKPTLAERKSILVAELVSSAKASQMGTEGKTVKDLAEYQKAVATKLGEMGSDAREALPHLLAEIKRPIKEHQTSEQEAITSERLAMVDAVVKIAGPKESLPIIDEVLLDKNQFLPIMQGLTELYLNLEDQPILVVPMLTRLLERNSAGIKHDPPYSEPGHYRTARSDYNDYLIAALGDHGKEAASAVPALLKAYERSDDAGKLSVVKTLAKIGPPAKEALPALMKLLQSEDAALRRAATEAIAAISKK